MKVALTTLVVALAASASAGSAVARDALPQATQQVFNQRDGSTLYVFKDGKMAKEDRFGRAAHMRIGDTLETADGRKITVTSNEVARLDGLLNDGHRN